MNRFLARTVVRMVISAFVIASGCGGGGGGESMVSSSDPPAANVQSLAWDPPETYEDSTPLDPFLDLDYYEFYVREDMNFTDNDLPVAQVAAVEDILSPDGTAYLENLTTNFDLQNLLPFCPPGSAMYLSIRAVGIDGMKSDFSDPILWNQVS